MKKILLISILVFSTLSTFASFSFSLISKDTLYPVSFVDPVSSLSGIHYFYETISDESCDYLIFNSKTREYQRYVYREWDDSYRNNVLLSAGGYFSLFKFSWDKIQFELVGEAGLSSVFSLGEFSDMQGLDGTFLVGLNIECFNSFTIQASLKHYSSHWGDEMLMMAQENMLLKRDAPFWFTRWEYIRDNNLRIGLAYTGSEKFNLRASIEAPLPTSNFYPYSECPDNIVDPYTGLPYSERDTFFHDIRGDLGSFYKAIIIQTEAQYIHPLRKNLDFFAGIHFKFHQDGITNNTLTPRDDNRWNWDIEFDLITGIEIKDPNSHFSISLDLIFHHGRYPILNYKYKESQYISVGLSLR